MMGNELEQIVEDFTLPFEGAEQDNESAQSCEGNITVDAQSDDAQSEPDSLWNEYIYVNSYLSSIFVIQFQLKFCNSIPAQIL